MKKAKFYDADKYTEYFVNPTVKEMDSLKLIPYNMYFIRFIADNNTKQVYVWCADRLHFDALRFLNIPGLFIQELLPGYLLGTAEKQGGKYIMEESDRIDYQFTLIGGKLNNIEVLDEILNKTDWSWVNRYIYVDSYLNELREEFNRRLKIKNIKLSKVIIVERIINLAEKLIK